MTDGGHVEHRIAWFHCFAGIAGDMALASLIDAGASFESVHELLARLPLRGWSIEPTPVLRAGIAATYLKVNAKGDGVIRTFPAMRALVDDAHLPDRVRDRSIAALSALAHAEALLHRRNLDQVHFHELAGYDTILDIVGTMAALDFLNVDEVSSTPVSTGTGMVRTEHGHLPNPTPAVLELLRDAPLQGLDVNAELTTPTGAALISTLASSFGPLPAMRVEAIGYGAGSRELDGMPNCTEVVIGSPLVELQEADVASAGEGQPLILLEANLDDATGEQLADTLAALFAAGALDAWITPILMKKGRPGHMLSALCDVGIVPALRGVLVEETGTFGVRTMTTNRWASARHFEVVDIDGHPVRVKVGGKRRKVEHDDAARAARALGLSLTEVITRVEQGGRTLPN